MTSTQNLKDYYRDRNCAWVVLVAFLHILLLTSCTSLKSPPLGYSDINRPNTLYGAQYSVDRNYVPFINPTIDFNKRQWERYKIATILVNSEFLSSEESRDFHAADYYLYLIIKSYSVEKKKVEKVLEVFDENFVGMKKVSHSETVGLIPFSAPFSEPSAGVNIENYDLDMSRELIRMYGKDAGVGDARIAIYGSSSNLYEMPIIVEHFDAIDLSHYSEKEIGNVIEYLRESFEVRLEDELSGIALSEDETGYLKRNALHGAFSASTESKFTLLSRKVFHYISKSLDGTL